MISIELTPAPLINPLQYFKEKITQNQIVAIALGALSLLGISYALYQWWLSKIIVVQPSPSQTLMPFPIERPAVVQQAPAAAHPDNEVTSPNSHNNEPLKPTEIVFEHEDRTIVLPQDILGEIARHADFHPTLSNVCKGFFNTYENTYFSTIFHSCRQSTFLTERMYRIHEDNLTASNKEKVLAFYQDLIEEIYFHEGGEEFKQNILATCKGSGLVEGFEQLESWLNDVNLIKVFEVIIKQIPQAAGFFDGIKGQDTILKARNIREWMNSNPDKMSTLTELDFRFKKLSQLPKEINYFIQLVKLQIGYNNLKAWPVIINQMINLSYLDLYANNLKKIPAEINQLVNLSYLDLGMNKFDILPPTLWHLNKLITLNLSATKLKNLPVEIRDLVDLRCLDLSFNNKIILPTEIEHLTNLQALDLSYTGIDVLPIEIFKINKLKLLLIGYYYKPFPENFNNRNLKIFLDDKEFIRNHFPDCPFVEYVNYYDYKDIKQNILLSLDL
ncbi:MAG: leucine-rich repeat domain-containing protein [Candidatus Protochlamydia sp.]|nr:leucine-rich repeat domain-containing protein [Candidatus Protochlamydia sp.]